MKKLKKREMKRDCKVQPTLRLNHKGVSHTHTHTHTPSSHIKDTAKVWAL